MAAGEIPEGHLGGLTLEQERALQQAWQRLNKLMDVHAPEEATNGTAITANVVNGGGESNDKYGQTKEYTAYLAETSPQEIRKSVWRLVKCENPDSVLLRFLRARKWDVDKAIVMFISNIKWRQEKEIDRNIFAAGEGVALKEKMTADDEGFMLQYRSGKSYVRGLDKNRRPVYVVKPRLHNTKTQSDKAMENYILHTIESIRILVRDPYDTACLIFDLTGFGLKNMDFPAVRFIIQVFEARYPETLGVVLLHNAPWVFQGIWRLIRGWLDPVVAAKINFTRSAADLEKFVSRESLQSEYGGSDKYVYSYIEPRAGENDKLKEEEKRAKIQEERDEISSEYERATAEWCVLDCGTPEAEEKAKRRAELAEQLRQNYWRIDPHWRSRSFYDRAGILSAQGDVNFTPVA